jgi:hypothetical protein
LNDIYLRGLCLSGVWILIAQQTEKTLGAGRSEPEPEPQPEPETEAKFEPEVEPEAEPEPEADEDADLSGAIRLGQAFGTVLGVGVGLQLHAPPADVTGLWRVCSGAGAEAEPLEVASVAAGAGGAAVAEVMALQQHTSGAVVGREHRAPCADSQSCVLLGRWSHYGVLQLQQTFPERAEKAPVLWELTPVLLRSTADAGGPGDGGWSLRTDHMSGRWGGARGGPCEIVRYSAAAEVALAAATLRLSHLGAEEIRRAGAASVAFFLTAVFTEIYLCNVCSCQEILRRNGRGQCAPATAPRWRCGWSGRRGCARRVPASQRSTPCPASAWLPARTPRHCSSCRATLRWCTPAAVWWRLACWASDCSGEAHT